MSEGIERILNWGTILGGVVVAASGALILADKETNNLPAYIAASMFIISGVGMSCYGAYLRRYRINEREVHKTPVRDP